MSQVATAPTDSTVLARWSHVRISRDLDVPSRYRGTIAEVVNEADGVVTLNCQRRASPLVLPTRLVRPVAYDPGRSFPRR